MGNGSTSNNEHMTYYDKQLTVSEKITLESVEGAHKDEKGNSNKQNLNN